MQVINECLPLVIERKWTTRYLLKVTANKTINRNGILCFVKQGEKFLHGNTRTALHSNFPSSIIAVIVLCWRVFLEGKGGREADYFIFVLIL